MERVFSRTRVWRGRGFRRGCKNRPVFEDRVTFDSRRLQTSPSSGLPLSSESYVSASHPQAKSAAPKLWEDDVEPTAQRRGKITPPTTCASRASRSRRPRSVWLAHSGRTPSWTSVSSHPVPAGTTSIVTAVTTLEHFGTEQVKTRRRDGR